MALRVQGVEEAALLDLIRTLDERLQVYADEIDIRNYGLYVDRAQARFAVGFPLMTIIDDFWLASRCLEGRAELHHLKHPVEKLRTRRIEPVELGLLGGQTTIMLSMAEHFAFPILPVLAHTAPQEVRNEAAHCSVFFSTERIEGLRDLVGLAAAVWSAGLGAIIRGADDEAKLALDVVDTAAEAVGVHGGPDEPAPLVRYLRLNRGLRLLVDRNGAPLPKLVGEIVAGHLATLERVRETEPDKWARPPRAASYFDTSTAALLALAVLKAVPVEAAEIPAHAAPYRELFEAMGEVDRTEEEEARRAAGQLKYEKALGLLEEAGVVERGSPGPSAATAPVDPPEGED